jgi:hypothetical protein
MRKFYLKTTFSQFFLRFQCTLRSISIIRDIKEQAGQDFFLSGNNIPKSLNEEIAIIARNAIKKTKVNGFAVHVLHEKKNLIRYQIIAIEMMVFARYANTFHNCGEPDSDIKILILLQIRYDRIILISIFATFAGIKNFQVKDTISHYLLRSLSISSERFIRFCLQSGMLLLVPGSQTGHLFPVHRFL